MLITFLPMNRKIDAEAGTNLLQLARENGIDLGGTCAGIKTCGKCKALVSKGNDRDFSKEELKFLTKEERNAGMRLACCCTITQDTSVIISRKHQEKNVVKEMENDSAEDKVSTKNQPIDTGRELLDNRFSNTVGKPVDNRFSNTVGKPVDNRFSDTGINQVDDLTMNAGYYGVAFDIGTTTVEAELWNLDTKEKLGQQVTSNLQILYGADVISRITYANGSLENRTRLSSLIRECCNELIISLVKLAGIRKEEVVSVVVAANTTMSHLFLGKSLESLAKVPFQGISYDGEEKKADLIGIHIHPEGKVYVMPGIGGHVGSDTLGCILAQNLAYSDGTKLVMDIGTNGEIVLARNKQLFACSTAAGPAFEGASLHQGMRADNGAISKVVIKDGIIIVEVIGQDGGHIPVGICGSGVIEAISELYKSGMMDNTGRLLGKAGEDNYVTLWQGKSNQENSNQENSEEGNSEQEKVILTQKDIREIQLAKGAIYAGMLLLLREEHIKTYELDELYLAGTFGNYINISKSIHIGLLPHMDANKVKYIGNGALTGAVKILLGEVSKEEAEKISKSTKHLELALREDFQEEFIKAISFPEN